MKLYSNRLTYQLIDFDDLDDIHELHSLPETDEFNTLGIPNSMEETKQIIEAWISDNKKIDIINYTFAIKQTSDNQFIGLISLKLGSKKFKNAEVWYKLNSRFWNNGFGTESLTRIIDFGFKDLQLHRIEAGCAIANIASARLLEKVGMTKEGQKRKILPLKSGWADNFLYSILESDKNY